MATQTAYIPNGIPGWVNSDRLTILAPKVGPVRPMHSAHVDLASVSPSRSITLSNGRGGSFVKGA